MTARRSLRLYTLPLVLIVLLWAIVASSARVTGLFIILTAYWLTSGFADFAKVITITDQAITMRGYIGRVLRIEREDAVRCGYRRYRSTGRSGEAAFFEIAGSDGTHISVWRYGWGRNQKRIFAALNEWLRSSPAEVLPDVQRRLDRLSR